MKRYTHEIKNEARHFFIKDEWSAKRISDYFNGSPTVQTVINWAACKDKKSGLNWYEEREQFTSSEYEKMSPNSLAEKLYKIIENLAEADPKAWTNEDSDSLIKLTRAVETLVDVKDKLPVAFEVLTDYIQFTKENYPKLYARELKNELINSIRHFKNELKKRLR